jgi:hypothetical protein
MEYQFNDFRNTGGEITALLAKLRFSSPKRSSFHLGHGIKFIAPKRRLG